MLFYAFWQEDVIGELQSIRVIISLNLPWRRTGRWAGRWAWRRRWWWAWRRQWWRWRRRRWWWRRRWAWRRTISSEKIESINIKIMIKTDISDLLLYPVWQEDVTGGELQSIRTTLSIIELTLEEDWAVDSVADLEEATVEGLAEDWVGATEADLVEVTVAGLEEDYYRWEDRRRQFQKSKNEKVEISDMLLYPFLTRRCN